MTTSAELELSRVVVTPGVQTTTTLAVRNDSDIVEAYQFEIVGECAPWTTVDPPRLSLYPGTSGTVTVLLRPPRSPGVRAGEIPLGVRVVPTERPESGTVAEATVLVEPFGQFRAELAPRRRRAWRGARFRVLPHNEGNTPVTVSSTATQEEEQLRFRIDRQAVVVEPGGQVDAIARVRARSLIWFGRPVERPFHLTATPTTDPPFERDPPRGQELDGTLLQLPLLPRWLLALVAALLALVLAWFALVRPQVRSTARQAATNRTQQLAQAGGLGGATGVPPGVGTGTGPGLAAGGGPASATGQPGGGTGSGGGGGTGVGQQSSATIQVRTGGGARRTGTYVVPAGKVFRITDLLVANSQGDEGVLTLRFGQRTITTIALETFRNQDYHWVTPIDVPAKSSVVADVVCSKPGTPASGRQAETCLELLNVSGVLTDNPR
ncbi:MAG TPA: hypothetical protein VFX70_19635 [Mycobacteriales bacterium]|nr:hypothetical protein [Mycobacteriales bacterium]